MLNAIENRWELIKIALLPYRILKVLIFVKLCKTQNPSIAEDALGKSATAKLDRANQKPHNQF